MKMLSQFLIASTTWIVLLHPIQGLAQEDDDDSRNDESFRPSPAPRRPTFPHCFAKVVNMRYGLSSVRCLGHPPGRGGGRTANGAPSLRSNGGPFPVQ